jgi:hypothetical protein
MGLPATCAVKVTVLWSDSVEDETVAAPESNVRGSLVTRDMPRAARALSFSGVSVGAFAMISATRASWTAEGSVYESWLVVDPRESATLQSFVCPEQPPTAASAPGRSSAEYVARGYFAKADAA